MPTMLLHRFCRLLTLISLVLSPHCLGAASVEPLTQVKSLFLDTHLARGGKPCAVIYHPPSAEYQAAAQELSSLLQQRFGFELPTKPDDAQRTWTAEKQHVIALGNFGNSLLLRSLHLRSFVDPHSKSGVTPLDLRRRLQTVHDPWAEGRNVVMLGGIDLGNVKANFPRLVELVKMTEPGTAVLPRTIDPHRPISDGLKARIDEYHAGLPKMPLNYPAYHAGWVCKHYPSLMQEEFVPLYRDSIKRLVEHQSYVHLYLFRECRCWDVIEESPVLTDEDRLMITSFFRNSVADEKEGIGAVRRLLKRSRLIQGNHESQTACGVMVAADYLRRYYPDELHEKWYQEALSFFEPYRTKGSYVGDDEGMQGASIGNIMNAVYRIADNPADHPFLRRTVNRLMPYSNNFGMWSAYGDQRTPYRAAAGWFELAARIYDNPEYLWMAHFIRTASPTQRARIPKAKEEASWWPMPFAPKQPQGFVGLQWAEPDEILFSLARPWWVKRNQLTASDLFGRAAFRGGIGPEDDFLLLDGVQLNHAYDDQNGILEYSALGRTFLVSLDYCYGTKQSAHNVVAVSVDGMADVLPARVAVRKLWTDLPSFAATRTVLHPDGRNDWQKFSHPTADWERNILWLKNRFFVVFDRVIARRDGLHSAAGFWRMVGERRDVPNGIEMAQKAGDEDVRFRLTVHGMDSFTLGREEDPQATYIFGRYGKQQPPLDTVPPVIHMLKAHKAQQLKTGESFTMATCFWASSPRRQTELDCATVSDRAVKVELNGQPMLAALGTVSVGELDVDAELSLVSATRLCLLAGRRLAVGGQTVLEAQRPVSLEWDLGSGRCEVSSDAETRVVLRGQTIAVAKGRSTHQIAAPELTEQLQVALRSLPRHEERQQKHLPDPPKRLQLAASHKGSSAVQCLWGGWATRCWSVGRTGLSKRWTQKT